MVSMCSACKIIVWPPSEFCNRCMASTVWEKAPLDGVILELSQQDGQFFCVVELATSFRIVGRIISGIPDVGKKITVERCGMRDGTSFFDMQVLD